MRLRRVTHDRTRENEAGAAAKGLKQAGDNQRVDALRQERAEAGDREQDKTADQRRPPAETIGNRAVDELTDREPGDVDADRQLQRAGT